MSVTLIKYMFLFTISPYVAAIACSSISSDLSDVDCTNSFCSKVFLILFLFSYSVLKLFDLQIIASCTFMWFTTIALLVAVIDKDTNLLDK